MVKQTEIVDQSERDASEGPLFQPVSGLFYIRPIVIEPK